MVNGAHFSCTNPPPVITVSRETNAHSPSIVILWKAILGFVSSQSPAIAATDHYEYHKSDSKQHSHSHHYWYDDSVGEWLDLRADSYCEGGWGQR